MLNSKDSWTNARTRIKSLLTSTINLHRKRSTIQPFWTNAWLNKLDFKRILKLNPMNWILLIKILKWWRLRYLDCQTWIKPWRNKLMISNLKSKSLNLKKLKRENYKKNLKDKSEMAATSQKTLTSFMIRFTL